MISWLFPIFGTFVEMVTWLLVVGVVWALPVYLAAPKVGMSRWWSVIVLAAPAAISVFLLLVAFPDKWEPPAEEDPS